MADGKDPEFDAIDNSVDFEPETFEVSDKDKLSEWKTKPSTNSREALWDRLVDLIDSNSAIEEVLADELAPLGGYPDGKYFGDWDDSSFPEDVLSTAALKDFVDRAVAKYSMDEACIRKPIPEGMTIEQLVEEMEENEDTVECKKCGELCDKQHCRHDVGSKGWICENCDSSPVEESTTSSQKAVEAIVTKFDPNRIIELNYNGYCYERDAEDIANLIWENFLTEEDAASYGGLEALNDDAVWDNFLAENFEDLFDKYYDEIHDFYYLDAVRDSRKHSSSYYNRASNYWSNHDNR
jgi:hypothetical protein